MLFANYYWKKWIRKQGCKLAGGFASLHKNTTLTIEAKVELGHIDIRSANLNIGAYTYIRSGAQLDYVNTIGRFCSISSQVYIGQGKQGHPLSWVSSHPFQYAKGAACVYQYIPELTNIGHDVWIGDHVTILEGVTVGTGAIIATHALVTKDVPPYAVVAGNPAKIVKYRHSEEICQALLESEWWEYPVEALQQLPMNNPQEFIEALKNRDLDKVVYKKIKITHQGCTEL